MGYGVVGGGVAEVLEKNKNIIREHLGGNEIQVKYILDLREFPGDPFEDKIIHDFNQIVNDPEIQIVAETMGKTHPAFEFTDACLRAGKSVITSNKELVATYGDRLLSAAAENGGRYLFEASVGGGIPVIASIENSLTANDIFEIDGIVNGTTNYILSKMFEEGKDFQDVLADARSKGYVEANPADDIDGIDACRKICILCAMATGYLIPPDMIKTRGISEITAAHVMQAEKCGCTIKLIARMQKTCGGYYLAVEPYMVRKTNPLAGITDVYNGILIKGNAVGDVMLYGRGAGKLPTASAVVSDVIDIARHIDRQPPQRIWKAKPELYRASITDEEYAVVSDSLGEPLFPSKILMQINILEAA